MLTVQEFNSNFTKAIRGYFDNQSKAAIKNSVMNRIFQVEDSSEYVASYISTEGITLPTYIGESETPNVSNIGKGYKTTFESAEFAHSIIVTYKERLKNPDSTEKLKNITNAKKNGAIIAMNTFLEKETHRVFNEAFSSTSFLAPDGATLCADTHTWNSTGRTFDNLLASSALDLTVIDTVEKVGGAFVDAAGTNMPLNFKYILVKKGSKAAQAAKRIFGFTSREQYRPTSIGNLNIYEGSYTIIETPWLTSDTAYFFIADHAELSLDNPLFVDFTQRPAMQSEFKEQNNLDWTNTVAGSFKFGIRNMPFTILGSAGA